MPVPEWSVTLAARSVVLLIVLLMGIVPIVPQWRCLALAALGLAPVAYAQTGPGGGPMGGPPGLPPGVSREQMWPAPTAEDWKKPCLIHWQRTWEDAQALSKETGKPILVCVNMDGELASEHYAGVRYRQPETAALYDPYVCVIASVYRHNPRDYDDQGRRILCPRFGSVTCGEHIAIEPVLYEKYFDGKRVAPRHIGIEPGQSADHQEMYDVYYAWDTDTIFNALRAGIDGRPAPPPLARGDRSLYERVPSPDNADRTAVEQAYEQGDHEQRQALLQAALAQPQTASLDMLRLAIFGFDPDLSRLGRQALAQNDSPAAVDLIAEAMRVPLEASERSALIGALARLGETQPRARTLSVVYEGLDGRSSTVNVEAWSQALAGAPPPLPSDWQAVEARVDRSEEDAYAHPQDGATRLSLAEASLALAVDPVTAQNLAMDRRTAPKYSRLMYEDALHDALAAEQLGASGWRVDTAVALAQFYLGRYDEAYARAEKAVAAMPAGEDDWNAMAVLALFAQARQRAISKAVREKADWPPQWLTDVHSAYAVLERHPYCTDALVISHYDFLISLGAVGQASQVLEQGVTRFPDSWGLHARLRSRILADKGLEGLEPAYEARLRQPDAPRNLEWFAGYASLVAAEFHRRKGEYDAAQAAYERAVAHYEHGIQVNPDMRDNAETYIALAGADRARMASERGDNEGALALLLASLQRKPGAAASNDGLGISPVAVARILRSRLAAGQRSELVAQLDAALDQLDPALLVLPPEEDEGSAPSRPPRPGP